MSRPTSTPGSSAMPGHLPIEETSVFRRFVSLSNSVWNLTRSWDRFAQDTVGKQLVRALDSVGANMAEADGRFGDKEGIQFLTIARESAREARYWLERAGERALISADEARTLLEELNHASRELNSLITYRRRRAGLVKEQLAEYSVGEPRPLTANPEHLAPNPEPRTPKTEHLTPNNFRHENLPLLHQDRPL